MLLAEGVSIGPYEIVAPLGAGGMGEVYRAHDGRLGRDVAVKVLPSGLAAEPDRLQRFEQEARAAGALSHPNLLTVFDIGLHDGGPYIVFELLRGATLRQLLDKGPPPLRKALDYGVQIAHGLAAAHQKGIVHRDLKPDNLFVTDDGRVKILDFGLAKLRRALDEGVRSAEATASEITDAGAVVGTVGYMSPEQVRGLSADHRSDVFALGCVLYELLSGRRAFKGTSSVETLHAILKDDPPELSGTAALPPALERIARRCLEKSPDERFQSARDLAFALEALSGAGVSAPASAALPRRRRPWVRSTAFLLPLAGFAALWSFVGRSPNPGPPTYSGLTYRRGVPGSARFTSDGATVYFGARWESDPYKVFSTRVENPESLALPLPPDTDVLALSSRGELAVRLNRPHLVHPPGTFATLATVSLTGGEPRELAEDVQSADYSPDGTQLAIVRRVKQRCRLEFPLGNVLYDTANILFGVRVAPDGKHLALWERGEEGSHVAVFDLQGNKTLLGDGKDSAVSLAWAASGDELLYATRRADAWENAVVTSLSLRGRARSIMAVPGWASVEDLAPDGRALMRVATCRSGIRCVPPGQQRERDFGLVLTGYSFDLSSDGRMLLYSDFGPGRKEWTYLQRTDGSSGAMRLGEGSAESLSHDGRWALVATNSGGQVLLPVGAGEPRILDTHGRQCREAYWFPDGRRVLMTCREGGGMAREFVEAIDGSESRPLTPEGTSCGYAVSPDGREAACVDENGGGWIYPVDGKPPRPIQGLKQGDFPLRWAGDGSLFVLQDTARFPQQLFRLDLQSGRRALWKELTPSDPAGIVTFTPFVAPNGGTYAYQYMACFGTLYVLDGLR